MQDHTKSPRLYVDQALADGLSLTLSENAMHYLKNVLRAQNGAPIRLFNGRDGEFLAHVEFSGKKDLSLKVIQKLKPQKNIARKIHLYFAPLKKERMDFLVEKAVELGATDLHPILTQHSDVRKINDDRIRDQIIEAAEQCERMDLPTLHSLKDLSAVLKNWNNALPLFAAIERMDAQKITSTSGDVAYLVGPAGGFSEGEKETLCALPFVKPVCLGDNILRAETAAIAGLSRIV